MKVGPLLSLEVGYSCFRIVITDTAAVALDSIITTNCPLNTLEVGEEENEREECQI